MLIQVPKKPVNQKRAEIAEIEKLLILERGMMK